MSHTSMKRVLAYAAAILVFAACDFRTGVVQADPLGPSASLGRNGAAYQQILPNTATADDSDGDHPDHGG